MGRTEIADDESEASDSTANPIHYKVIENVRGVPAVPTEAVTTDSASAPRPATLAPSPAEPIDDHLERRKSVRMAVPDSPAVADFPVNDPMSTSVKPRPASAQGQARMTTNTDSNGSAATNGGWSSRIGRGHDSSDEEMDPAYAKAKRKLTDAQKRFSGLQGTTVPKKKVEKRAKSRNSIH